MIRVPADVYKRKAAERDAAKQLADLHRKNGNLAIAEAMMLRYRQRQREIKELFSNPNIVITEPLV